MSLVIRITDPELKKQFWDWFDNLHPEEKLKLKEHPWDVAESVFLARLEEYVDIS